MNLTYPKYIMIEVALTTLLGVSLLVSFPACLTAFFALLFFLSSGFGLGSWFFPQDSCATKTGKGILVVFGALLTTLTVLYYPFGYSLATLLVSITIICVKALFARRNTQEDILMLPPLPWTPYLLLTVVASLGEVALSAFILSRRFSDTLISPWTLFGPRFFVGALIITTLSLITLFSPKAPARRLVLALFLARAVGVATAIFAFGFGFDPVIHEAAMKTIMAAGEILPKTPYYIGEYMLILPLHTLSHISLSILHAFTVPLLFTFGTVMLLRARKAAYSPLSIALLALWPLSFFIQTTPNNLALLFAWFAILTLERHEPHNRLDLLAILFCVASAAIHPFIGVPALIAVLTLIAHKEKRKWLYRLGATLTFLCTPLLLFANGFLAGSAPTFLSPITHPTGLLSLFASPYWWIWDNASLLWRLLYTYRIVLPYLIIFALLAGKKLVRGYRAEKTIAFLLVLSAIVLTSIGLPGVIGYEQGVYASRLFTLATLFLFPCALELLDILQKKYIAEHTHRIVVASIILAPLLLISWYFTYPTRDAISKHTGYNIRAADIAAVHVIAERNTSTPYIVLTNQMVSAAALKEFSFSPYYTGTDGALHYFYSIPTGGPLYQWFRHMVYDEPKRKWMVEAMRFAGVKKAYFVHTNYWAPAATIRDEAKKEADSFFDIGDGRVWVYEYTLSE